MNVPLLNPKIIGMPDVARLTGASVNSIRDKAAALEAAGLIVRVGPIWVTLELNAPSIAKAVGARQKRK